MNVNNKNTDRHLELTAKLIEMGQALMIEGKENKDFTIAQAGTFLILVGGLLFEEEDVKQFGQLCSMFSAKRVLDSMVASQHEIGDYIKKKAQDESYDDYIKRINDLRSGTKPSTD